MANTSNGGTETGERLLRLRDVESKIGLKKTFIYAAMARGEFPEGIRFSRRAVLWPASAIDAWIAAQIANAQSRCNAGR